MSSRLYSERDESMMMLLNSCISKVNKTVIEGGEMESGREFQRLTVKAMKEWQCWLTCISEVNRIVLKVEKQTQVSSGIFQWIGRKGEDTG